LDNHLIIWVKLGQTVAGRSSYEHLGYLNKGLKKMETFCLLLATFVHPKNGKN
jgi:hypothetical protein